MPRETGMPKTDLEDVLQPALADVLAAAEVADHGGQARAEGVGGDRGGDVLAGDVAAAGAGAGVALELGHDGGDARQLGDLVPGRLGVAVGWLLGQRGVAPLAVGGDQRDDVIDAVGRQALAAMAGVSGLPAGGTTRTLLDDRGLGAGRVGRGRDGGVGGVLAQPGFQILDPLLQLWTRWSRAAMTASRSTHPGQAGSLIPVFYASTRPEAHSDEKRAERLRFCHGVWGGAIPWTLEQMTIGKKGP